VVQGVVVHHVEAVAGGAGQVEHQVQVGVVVGHPLLGGGVDVAHGHRRGPEAGRGEGPDRQRGVAAGGGVHRHVVAAPDEQAGEVVGQRLETAGERLRDRVAVGGDQADPHEPARPDRSRE
jgi:hypothetical protein